MQSGVNKAIFLDRDGTINVDKNYLYKKEEFEFIPGVVTALKQLSKMGFLLIIITNQSGIARGYYSEEDFLKLNDWMEATLRKQEVMIEKVYYCPHLPDAKIERYRKECDCRKPAIGMFTQAVNEYEIDLSKSYAIGDRMRDLEICKRSKCKGILVNDNLEEVIDECSTTITRCHSLDDAAQYIKEKEEDEQ